MWKKGQNWSMEVIIAVSVFLVLFITIIGYATVKHQSPIKELDAQAQTVFSRVSADETTSQDRFTFIENNQVNKAKLEEISSLSYEELQQEFGIKDDFCVILVDASGNYITINKNGQQVFGLGSSEITLSNGKKCGLP